MTKQIEFYQKHGYMDDKEVRLRSIGNGREGSLANEAANQIKHLKDCLEIAFDYLAQAHAETLEIYENHPLPKYKEVIDEYETVLECIEVCRNV